MPRAKENKLYRTFVKGLITEAGYLTYPEDASTDELNTVLSRKGNRTRRLGIDYENNYQTQDFEANVNEGNVVNEFVWKGVANKATDNFLCIQLGQMIYFYSLEAAPVSDSLKSFSIDLSEYKIPSSSLNDLTTNIVEFSSGKGFLFVVHPYTEPLIVEYTSETDTITVTRVIIQIRDFEGLHDGLANDQEPSVLSKEHEYNLKNQGWVQPGTYGAGSSNTSTYIDPYTGETKEYEINGDPNPV